MPSNAEDEFSREGGLKNEQNKTFKNWKTICLKLIKNVSLRFSIIRVECDVYIFNKRGFQTSYKKKCSLFNVIVSFLLIKPSIKWY